MDFKEIMLSEKSQSQKVTLIQCSRNVNYKNEGEISGWQGSGAGEEQGDCGNKSVAEGILVIELFCTWLCGGPSNPNLHVTKWDRSKYKHIYKW